MMSDPTTLVVTFFVVAGFFLLVHLTILVKRMFLQTNHTSSCSDFDLSVATLEQSIKNDSAVGDGGDGLDSPLLLPPPSCIYRLEDRQFGILHKKSGHVFLDGFTAPTMMRLHFSTDGCDNGFAVIRGGSTILIPSSVAPVATNNNKNNNNNVMANSRSVVQTGLVSLSTKMAYFVESYNGTGGTTTRRVVLGQFEDGFTSFSGEWLNSNAVRGCLTTYKGAISTADLEALDAEEGDQLLLTTNAV